MFECGGNKTFKNLEQCHEIQGEFKRKPIYITNSSNNDEEKTINKNNKNLNEKLYDDDESELNIIIYNSDEFYHDKMNNKEKNKENFKHNDIKSEKRIINESSENNKKEKDINVNNSTNNKNINENIDNFMKFMKKDNLVNNLKNKSGIRLIHNNSESNIKRKINPNKNNKKDLNVSKNKFKPKESKNNLKQSSDKYFNNLFINKKYRQLNYAQYNNINLDKIICETENNKKKNRNGKIQKQIIKRNKSHQIFPILPKSAKFTNSKLRKSSKLKKGNYVFRPKMKPKNFLHKDNNFIIDYFGNETKRKTNLTSASGNSSPKLPTNKYFKRNDEELVNKYFSNENTITKKYHLSKLSQEKKSQNYFGSLIKAKNNNLDLNIFHLEFQRRHHSNNETNNFKINEDKKDKDTNKIILKLKILFKGTQINHNLLNSAVNDEFILNYNMLSKLSNKAIIYDGNIYKVSNSKNGESKFILNYFQITKKYFSCYNNVQSLLMINWKPLEEFEIKYIKNIEIVDLNLLKKKNDNKIKFSFVVNLVENINFFIFATDNADLGMNIINILNLIKKFFDEGKDLFK